MVPAAGSVSIPTSMPESGHEAPRLPVWGIPGRGRPLWILPAPQTQHRGGKPQMSPVPWPQFPWSSVSREDGFSDTHCPWGSSPECRRTPKQGKGPHEPYTKVTHTQQLPNQVETCQLPPRTMGKLTKLRADALLNSYHGAHRTRITGPPGQGSACPPSWAFLQVWTQ